MPCARGILDQNHFPGPDDARFAITSRDLDAIVEIDDILPTRGVVPIEIVRRGNLSKDDARGRNASR
jgi:hypothetical protein